MPASWHGSAGVAPALNQNERAAARAYPRSSARQPMSVRLKPPGQSIFLIAA
jgi:hypothetical protein